MIQLFNKDGQGSIELNRLTGTFHANADYGTIEQELFFATREVAGLVGDAVVEAAADKYAAGEDDDYVNAVRLPVAVLAVSRWVQRNGVSHGDTGRKITADENEKIAFEWMVDRDDRAMTEQYYRSLDALYEYLDKHAVREWLDSGKKKAFDGSLVTSLQQLEDIYPVEGSYYLYHRLQGLILEAQQARVKGMLGAKWADITKPDVADEDRTLLSLARRYAVLKALQVAVSRWSLEAFPLRIARRFAPSYQGNRSSTAATREEIDWFLGNIDKQLEEIRDLITQEMNDGESGWNGRALLPGNDRRQKFFTAQ